MKRLLILSALGLLILFSMSCFRNRLKTNEKELTEEILSLEKKNLVAANARTEKKLEDTLKRPHKGMSRKEDRSIDTTCPPLMIDISGNLNNIKEFKLSDLASEIKYVRIQTVPDSTFLRDMKFKYYLFTKYIIAINPSGILLYTNNGKFVTTIVKNNSTGIIVDSKRMVVSGVNTFIGGGTSIWASGDIIYYNYRNSVTGQEYIMEYDMSKKGSVPINNSDPDQIRGQGEIAIDVNPGNKKPEWKNKIAPELVMWGYTPEYIYQSVRVFLLDINTYAKETDYTDKISIINKLGDTLAILSGFTKDNCQRLEYDGKQILWDISCDTLFEVKGSNRITPIYVLNLGHSKVKVGSDLNGKIILTSFAQNKDNIFLTFSMDAYDIPRNRVNKTVKIYHAVYSKLTNQFYIVKGDPLNYTSEIFENNLDGGIPVWPMSYMIGNDGEILLSLKGRDLKDRVKSKEFKVSGAPDSKKKEFEELAVSVSESEDILMIIK